MGIGMSNMKLKNCKPQRSLRYFSGIKPFKLYFLCVLVIPADYKIYVLKNHYLSSQRKDLKQVFCIKGFPLCALWFYCRIEVKT